VASLIANAVIVGRPTAPRKIRARGDPLAPSVPAKYSDGSQMMPWRGNPDPANRRLIRG
jgi:hypothetical protein